jgi:hypothetical protein
MKNTIQAFLKFGAENHINDLYENGTVYLNTIEYFRKCEDEELRGDEYEGTNRIINSLPGSFIIPGINHTVNYEKVHVKEAYDIVVGNLYCIYCISSHGFPNPSDFEIDTRNIRFGTHCIIIKEPGTFIKKVEDALREGSHKFSHNLVKYYDKSTYSGELTLFHKSLEFEYQKEFRFSVENSVLEPIILNIGSMKEYSEVLKIEDAIQMRLTGAWKKN